MMRGIGAVTLSMLAFVGCSSAGCASAGKRTGLAPMPDTSRQIRVSGRWTTASACPISERIALTAAHVIDPRPFDRSVGYTPVAFQQGDTIGTFTVMESRNAEGQVVEQFVSRSRDLAYVESNVPLMGWYPRAQEAPQPGDRVYFYGLDWRSKKNAFAERVWTATVIRTMAGLVIYEPAGEPGTSGSCVLNEKAEVVAVNVAGMLVGIERNVVLGAITGGEEVGIGVGVWQGLGAAEVR